MRLSSAVAAVIALAPVACATPLGTSPVYSLGWQCNSEATSGDVWALSSHSLDLDGRLRHAFDEWRWNSSQGDVEVSMQQWLGAPPVPSPNVLIFVNPSGHAGRRLVAVELAVGEGAPRQTERDLVDRRPHEPQYYLRIAMERLVALSASNQRVYVVGFERGDVVAFRIPIDLGAISRGREALRLRVERTTEMAGRFASLCQRELPDPLSVIA